MKRIGQTWAVAPKLPDQLLELLTTLPANVCRKQAAEVVTQHFFPVSPRTLERWPLKVRHVNGKAIIETADVIAEAWRRFEAAPVLAGGSSQLRPAATSPYPESDYLE